MEASVADRPLLFLDIDGVLNCQGWTGPDYEQLKRKIGKTEHCVIPPGTSDRVKRLVECYEPVWATAWLGGAADWREALDIEGSWPYINFIGLKLPEIIKYAAGRKWAWVDDDAYWELQQLGWIEKQIVDTLHGDRAPFSQWGFGDDGLIVAPDGRFGLTDEIVHQLEAFANAT